MKLDENKIYILSELSSNQLHLIYLISYCNILYDDFVYLSKKLAFICDDCWSFTMLRYPNHTYTNAIEIFNK